MSCVEHCAVTVSRITTAKINYTVLRSCLSFRHLRIMIEAYIICNNKAEFLSASHIQALALSRCS